MFMKFIAGIVGERWATLASYVIVGLLCTALVLTVTHCMGDDNDDVVAQAEQTNRSGEAINAAAADAIDTIGNRVATEDSINQAVEKAVEEVNNAQTVDAVRAAVLAGVCQQDAHRNDSACRMRQSGP